MKRKLNFEFEIKYKSLDEMPIGVFVDLQKDLSKLETDIAKDIKLVSYCTNITEDAIRELDINVYKEILNNLIGFVLPESKETSEFEYNGEKYYIDINAMNATVKQWEQFESIVAMNIDEWDKVIPIFALILKKDKDEAFSAMTRLQRQELILDMPTSLVYSIVSFFLRLQTDLETITQIFIEMETLKQNLPQRTSQD